jgi:hypothetical protein
MDLDWKGENRMKVMNSWYEAEQRLFGSRSTAELKETLEGMKNGFMYHRRRIRLQAIEDILLERGEDIERSP